MEAVDQRLHPVRPRSGSFSYGDTGEIRAETREIFAAAIEQRRQQEITSLKRRKIAKISLFASSGISLGLGIILAKVLAVTAFTLAMPYIGAGLALVLFSTALYMHLKYSSKQKEHVLDQSDALPQQFVEEPVREEAPNPLFGSHMRGVFPYHQELSFQPQRHLNLLPPPSQDFPPEQVASLEDESMRDLSSFYSIDPRFSLLPAFAPSLFPLRTGLSSQLMPHSLSASVPSSMTVANERQVSFLRSNRELPLASQRSALRVSPLAQSLLATASQPIQLREMQLLASATQQRSQQHFQVIRHLNHRLMPPVNIIVNYEVSPSTHSPAVTVSRRILIEPLLESSSGLKGVKQITQSPQIAKSLPLALSRWVRGLVMPHSTSPFFMSFQQSILYPSRDSMRMVPTSGFHLFGLKRLGVNPFAYLEVEGFNAITRTIAPLTFANRVQQIPHKNGKLLTAGVSAVSIASGYILNKLMPQRKASYGMATRFSAFPQLSSLAPVTKPSVNFSAFPWLGFASPRFAPAPVSHFASPFRRFSQIPPLARPFSGLSFGVDTLLPTFKTVALIGSAPPFDFAKWRHTDSSHVATSLSALRRDPSSSSASSATLTNTELDETASLTASLTDSMTASMTASDTSSTASTAVLDSFFLNE